MKTGIYRFLINSIRKVIAPDISCFFQTAISKKVRLARLILPNPVLFPMLSARCGIIRLISSG
jgi:hypothetical protein